MASTGELSYIVELRHSLIETAMANIRTTYNTVRLTTTLYF